VLGWRILKQPGPTIMKILFDFFPILLFFIAYKWWGIYVATAVTIAASLIQVFTYRIKAKHFDNMHLVTLVIVVLLGSTTLLLHNELFIKWKPTVVYWIFALLFVGSQFIGKNTLIQRLLSAKLNLPERVWRRLNASWAIFFVLMGAANVYVLYHFSTDAWVNFKLFGTLGLTLLFVVVQGIYMSRHIQITEAHKTTVKPPGDR
jgi:intracellular septation protein